MELEKTKAQMQKFISHSKMFDFNSEDCHQAMLQNQISTPSMKAMLSLVMDGAQNLNSSTESTHGDNSRPSLTKRRPSKIPLSACSIPKSSMGKSLLASNDSPSLTGKSSSDSIQHGDLMLSNIHHPEPLGIQRKDASLVNISRSNSSIPTPKVSPTRSNINAPVLKARRESLTSKIRHADSLSRSHMSSNNSYSSTTSISPSHTYRNVNTNYSRERKSSAGSTVTKSGVGSRGVDLTATPEPIEKVQNNFRRILNIFKI